ncbi:MOSC domain-containing protein [Alkalicoccus halolimnae]|uniref:MOSC N-terminal beta barrel domain-containing protein n=1 Tax=Alkalicoccus halolimnae TaxID=1667239 RepID=A0A5C7F0A4_9BACI|nr:MOSC N-terminal beta barrel domain-containing protein [Alkalicoccus halolimnae]TXF82557.1 MOSC domain-containing protein [Alkalicoccus halolimnae]
MTIGRLKDIIRYPVKSFRGEHVTATTVMKYGLYGDRSHALLDDKRDGKFLTITQCPRMVLYEASFKGTETVEALPWLEVRNPEGRIFAWEEDQLKKELENAAGTSLTFKKYSPEYVPAGAIEEEHILLITDASLAKLEETWGKEKLDAARFRPNIIVSLEDKIPFIEDSWTGRKIKLGGEAVIKIERPCERCMIINVDPQTGEQEPGLLKTVVKERNNCFGMYASVVKTGEITSLDKVEFVPED